MTPFRLYKFLLTVVGIAIILVGLFMLTKSSALSDRAADITFVVIVPGLLVLLGFAPFVVTTKILKRKLSSPVFLFNFIVAIGLLALYVYGLYWGIQILGSLAVMELYGGSI